MPKHSISAAPETRSAGQDTPNLPDFDSTPQDIQSFLGQYPNAKYTCKVYHVRANAKGGNKPDRQLIDEWEDTYPSIRELGTENGAGTYEYFFYIAKQGGPPELRTMRINLAPRWDLVRDEYLQSRGINPATRPDGLQASLTVMKDMIQVITPLLQSQAQAAGQGNGSAGGATAVLNSMIEMQGKMLNQNFQSQMEMQNKVMNTLEESRKTLLSDDDGGGNDNMLISEIISTLKGFVPLLMVAPPKAAQAATNTVMKDRPDVRSLVDSAGRRAALVARIEKEFPPQTAKKVLSVLHGVSGGNGAMPQAAAPAARTAAKTRAAARK